jgi:hypothetical protein
MKIGILATGYNCAEYFDKALEPWLEFKKRNEGKHELIISVVSALFKGNELAPTNDSVGLLTAAYKTKKLDYLILPVGSFEEKQARNMALKPLLLSNVDYIMLFSFDEIYTVEEITKIFEFVEMNPFTVWFKIHFKNFVGDTRHYVDNFCPPRIFKTQNLDEFYFDDDLLYDFGQGQVSYKTLSSMAIPKNLAFVKHYSWCESPEKLKQKIKYQLEHFNGICSYRWDEESHKLALNYDFYHKFNVPIPIIYEEK